MLVPARVGACASGPRAPVVERSAARPRRHAPAVGHRPRQPQLPRRRPLQPTATTWSSSGDTLYSIALETAPTIASSRSGTASTIRRSIKVGQALRVKPPERRGVPVGRPAIIGRIESRPLETRTGARQPHGGSPKASARPPAAGGESQVEFIWPVKGKVIAGFAEPRSKGIDIDGKVGDPVVAAAAGRVTYIGNGIPGSASWWSSSTTTASLPSMRTTGTSW